MPLVELTPFDEQDTGWSAADVQKDYIPLLADPLDNDRLKAVVSRGWPHLRYRLDLINKSDRCSAYDFRLLKKEDDDLYWGYTRKALARQERGEKWRLSRTRQAESIWLPRSIARNDPNVIVAKVSKGGLIDQVWVHKSFAGRPIPGDQLPGLHVRDVLAPDESRRILAYIEAALSRNIPACGTVTLALPVRHKRRQVRILPLNNSEVLAYLVKK